MRQPEPSPAAPSADLAEAIRFQRDLYLYWRTIRAVGGLQLTARRFVARPALRRLRMALAAESSGAAGRESVDAVSERDDTRLLYLRRLLERLGLLRPAEGEASLVAADAALMGRYLAHPLARRVRICTRLWATGGWWPDVPDAHVELPPLSSPAPPPVARARQWLLDALGALHPGEAIALPGPPLSAASDPSGQVTRPRARKHTSPRKPGAVLRGEEVSARAALLGPLIWMGLVTCEDATCRMTAAIAALREEAGAGLEERAGRVVVQPNLAVVTYPPLTAPTLFTLDACAEVTALEMVARYQLTREAFARARRFGWSAAEVAARLEALTGAPLPANVRVTLSDWERHIERVRLTPAVTVLEVREAAVLDALLADAAANAWVTRRLTPTAALLRRDAVDAVRAWLLKRGELPAVLDGQQ
jgi:hypothetical protein